MKIDKFKRVEPHGSPEGSFDEPRLTECECQGVVEMCDLCDGTGQREMDADEMQLDHEARMEEQYEY